MAGFSKGIRLSSLSAAAQASVRAQIGATHFDKLLKQETPGKRHKFGVSAPEQRTLDGIVFDSKFEMEVYKLLKAEGIRFERQVSFVLQEPFIDPFGKKQRGIYYVADFVIGPPRKESDSLTREHWVVDAKGFRTAEYKRSRKMFMARYRAVIHEVDKASDVRLLLDVVAGKEEFSVLCKKPKKSLPRRPKTATA